MQETYCVISDLLDSRTPFGRDSVPEVYIMRTGSSSSMTMPGADASPVVIHSATGSNPCGACTPAKGIHPRMSMGVPAVAIASMTVGPSASSTTTPDAWLWSRMKAISETPSPKLIGTRIAPIRAHAKFSTANCHEL